MLRTAVLEKVALGEAHAEALVQLEADGLPETLLVVNAQGEGEGEARELPLLLLLPL